MLTASTEPIVIRLRINGMTCGHCEKAVEGALAGVAGVTRVVQVSRERGEALIDGDAEIDALIAAVEEEGYQAEALV
jgi:copper chaperone